jgi:hypothetical protein
MAMRFVRVVAAGLASALLQTTTAAQSFEPASDVAVVQNGWLDLAAGRHARALQQPTGNQPPDRTPPRRRFRWLVGGELLERLRVKLAQKQSTLTTTFLPPGGFPVKQSESSLQAKNNEVALEEMDTSFMGGIEIDPGPQAPTGVRITIGAKGAAGISNRTIKVTPPGGTAQDVSGAATTLGGEGSGEIRLASPRRRPLVLRADYLQLWDLLKGEAQLKPPLVVPNVSLSNDRVDMDTSSRRLGLGVGVDVQPRLTLWGRGEWNWFSADLRGTAEGRYQNIPFMLESEDLFDQQSLFSAGPSISYRATPNIDVQGSALFGAGYRFQFSLRYVLR